jgi:hypothetical protein
MFSMDLWSYSTSRSLFSTSLRCPDLLAELLERVYCGYHLRLKKIFQIEEQDLEMSREQKITMFFGFAFQNELLIEPPDKVHKVLPGCQTNMHIKQTKGKNFSMIYVQQNLRISTAVSLERKCWVDPKSRFLAPNFYPQLLTGNGKSDVGSFADCTLKKGHPI